MQIVNNKNGTNQAYKLRLPVRDADTIVLMPGICTHARNSTEYLYPDYQALHGPNLRENA